MRACVRYWAALSSEQAAYLTKSLSECLCVWASISQRQSGRSWGRRGWGGGEPWFLVQVVTATILPMKLDGAEKSVRENSTLADLNRRAPVCEHCRTLGASKGNKSVLFAGSRLLSSVKATSIRLSLRSDSFRRAISLSFASYNIRNDLKCNKRLKKIKKRFWWLMKLSISEWTMRSAIFWWALRQKLSRTVVSKQFEDPSLKSSKNIFVLNSVA